MSFIKKRAFVTNVECRFRLINFFVLTVVVVFCGTSCNVRQKVPHFKKKMYNTF